MIIDSHAHIGKIIGFDMPKSTLVESMNKYGIDFSIVSNIEGCEVDHQQNIIETDKQFDQIEVNKKMLDIAKKNPARIGAALWIKPVMEGCTSEFENLIKENRDMIYALKVHPYHSKLAFNDSKIIKYMEIAEKYDLVVVTHTGKDYESRPELVYKVAKKFPKVDFVMYHMGLGTDNEVAIELISRLPNLYGDTAWVDPKKTLKAINICGSHKIIFGTDNPINGIDTYCDPVFYKFYFNEMKDFINKDEYENFMYKNAKNLFKISN